MSLLSLFDPFASFPFQRPMSLLSHFDTSWPFAGFGDDFFRPFSRVSSFAPRILYSGAPSYSHSESIRYTKLPGRDAQLTVNGEKYNLVPVDPAEAELTDAGTSAYFQAAAEACQGSWKADDHKTLENLTASRLALPGTLQGIYKARIPTKHNDRYLQAEDSARQLTDASIKYRSILLEHLSDDAASALQILASGSRDKDEDDEEEAFYDYTGLLEDHFQRTGTCLTGSRAGNVVPPRYLESEAQQSLAFALKSAAIIDVYKGLQELSTVVIAHDNGDGTQASVADAASALWSEYKSIIDSTAASGVMTGWVDRRPKAKKFVTSEAGTDDGVSGLGAAAQIGADSIGATSWPTDEGDRASFLEPKPKSSDGLI